MIPLLHKYPVRTDTEDLWEEGNVMLGFDAEERFIPRGSPSRCLCQSNGCSTQFI